MPRIKLAKAPINDMRPSLKVSEKASHSDNKAQHTNSTVAYNGTKLEKIPIELKIGSNKAVNPNSAKVKLTFEC